MARSPWRKSREDTFRHSQAGLGAALWFLRLEHYRIENEARLEPENNHLRFTRKAPILGELRSDYWLSNAEHKSLLDPQSTFPQSQLFDRAELKRLYT